MSESKKPSILSFCKEGEAQSVIPVAVYCRVSTTHPHQLDSLENQMTHYEKIIEKHPEYRLTKVYYDYGISGYKEKRPGFNQMLQDAEKGFFRQIITKSVTRFARNTDTVLNTTRQLKKLGIDVYFELQKIHTMSQEGELLLTLLAAFGQEESENSRWLMQTAIRRKYEKNQPVRQLHRCLGYRKNEDGVLLPYENAELVRQIFQMAADGWRICEITRYLNANSVKTQNGKKFSPSSVSRILHNHAYKGDYICQRYYVDNQRRLVKNKGEKPMYYIRNDHAAIVSEELWERAQKGLESVGFSPIRHENIQSHKKRIAQVRPEIPQLTYVNYPYKDRIFCKYCGSRLRRIIARNGSVWWICDLLSRKGKAFCKGIRVPDEKLLSLCSINFPVYIGKEAQINGEEAYGYSTKPDE